MVPGWMRRRGPSSRPGPAPGDAESGWPPRLRDGTFEDLARLVVRELATVAVLDVAALASGEIAGTVDLGPLAYALADVPRRNWPARVHAYYTPRRRQLISAGAQLEARTPTFEAARTLLVPLWRNGDTPAADLVGRSGPAPGTHEVLSLVDPSVVRTVTRSHFTRWGVSMQAAFEAACDNILSGPLTRSDGGEWGHPAVKIVTAQGAVGGALLRCLEQVDPEAVGPCGTLIWVPFPNGIVYRALAPGVGVREDLASATVAFLGPAADARFVAEPLWRRPDGSVRAVGLRAGDSQTKVQRAKINDPGLWGALAVLEPEALLPVAGWAQGVLDAAAYQRFAGLVSYTLDGLPERDRLQLRPVDLRHFGTALGLPDLARSCAGTDPATWPATIGTYLRARQASDKGLHPGSVGPAVSGFSISALPPTARYRHDVSEVLATWFDGGLRTCVVRALTQGSDAPAYVVTGVRYPLGLVPERNILEPDEARVARAVARYVRDRQRGDPGPDAASIRRLLAELREAYVWPVFAGSPPPNARAALVDALEERHAGAPVVPAGKELTVFAARADATGEASRTQGGGWTERLPFRDACLLASRLTNGLLAVEVVPDLRAAIPRGWVTRFPSFLEPDGEHPIYSQLEPREILATTRPEPELRAVLAHGRGWMDGEPVYDGLDLAGERTTILERDILAPEPAPVAVPRPLASDHKAPAGNPLSGAASAPRHGENRLESAEAALIAAVEVAPDVGENADGRDQGATDAAMRALAGTLDLGVLWFSLRAPPGTDMATHLFVTLMKGGILALDSEIGSPQPLSGWTDLGRCLEGGATRGTAVRLPFREACRLTPGLATRGILINPGQTPTAYLPTTLIRALPEPLSDAANTPPGHSLPHRHRIGRIMATTIAQPGWDTVRLISLSDARDGARYDVANRAGAFRRIDESELVEPDEANLVRALDAFAGAAHATPRPPHEEVRERWLELLRCLIGGYVWIVMAPPAVPNPEASIWAFLTHPETEGGYAPAADMVPVFADRAGMRAGVAARPGRWGARVPFRALCRAVAAGGPRAVHIHDSEVRVAAVIDAHLVRAFPEASVPEDLIFRGAPPADPWPVVPVEMDDPTRWLMPHVADRLVAALVDSPQVERAALVLAVGTRRSQGAAPNDQPGAASGGASQLVVRSTPGGAWSAASAPTTELVQHGVELVFDSETLQDDDVRPSSSCPVVWIERPGNAVECADRTLERSATAVRHGMPHSFREGSLMLTQLPRPRRVVLLGHLVDGPIPPTYFARDLDGTYREVVEAEIVPPDDFAGLLAAWVADKRAPEWAPRLHAALRSAYVWLPLPPPAPPDHGRTLFRELRQGRILTRDELFVFSSSEHAATSMANGSDTYWLTRLPMAAACRLAGDHALRIDPRLPTGMVLPPDLVRAIPESLVDEDPWFRGVPPDGLNPGWRAALVAAAREDSTITAAYGWTELSGLAGPAAGAIVEVVAVLPASPLDAPEREALFDRLHGTARRHGLPEGWHYRTRILPTEPRFAEEDIDRLK